MKKILILLFVLAALLLPMGGAEAHVAILCYHEVDKPGDAFAVTHSQLESHLASMQREGYRFVSLDEYIAYAKGELTLPEKSVMITFDDGYRSFYTKVYPLLQKYKVPGMLAIVSSWTVGEEKPNDVRDLASWQELREMEASGLVTVVSHSHALHKQQAINPQGGRNGVAGSHLYFQGRYETDAEYETRIGNDLNEVQRLFEENLGHKSRAMVWPYGIYSEKSVALARQSGMEATFLLDGGVNPPGENSLYYARRMIIDNEMDVSRLDKLLTVNHDAWNSRPLRLAQVDLDSIRDEDAEAYESNIRSLISNLEGNNINLVALQAFADPDGDGDVDAVYFPNGELPMAADIFGDVANRLMQRGITVVAWLPVLSYQPFIHEDGSNAVQSTGEKGWYHRLSPFAAEDLTKVSALFRDLAANTQVGGILLQDDLYLGEEEDVSPLAQAAYLRDFGRKMPVPAKLSPEEKQAFARWKSEALDRAAEAAITAFREMRPQAITMRDIYAGALLYPGAEAWLGQSYEDYLAKYDYTVVMAYPYMDSAADPKAYLQDIARAVQQQDGLKKTIVKVQSYDWKRKAWLDARDFGDQLKTLKRAGIRNMGYYPAAFAYWEK